MITTTKHSSARTASALTTLADTARAVVGALAASWTIMQNRRRIRALGELDDYLLADMGLTREDLREAYATPVHLDASLRLAVLAQHVDRPTTECRPRGRRGDAHSPSLMRRLP